MNASIPGKLCKARTLSAQALYGKKLLFIAPSFQPPIATQVFLLYKLRFGQYSHSNQLECLAFSNFGHPCIFFPVAGTPLSVYGLLQGPNPPSKGVNGLNSPYF
jgi:hypothetical protein